MAWVGGLLVVLTISVNIGVRMATEPTTPSISSSSVSMSTHWYGSSTKPQSQPLEPSKAPTSAAPSPSIQTQKPTQKNSNARTKYSMSESVVILSPNSEREAQEIYDKALKQYDSYGVTTRQICASWEKRGCQCSGSVEELVLACRGIGLNEAPTNLPKNLIKL